MLDLKRSVSAARPLLSSGNLIYALIILGRLNPAVSGRYTAGGWQEEEEEEREGVTETEKDREPEGKGRVVREAVLEAKGHCESSQRNT